MTMKEHFNTNKNQRRDKPYIFIDQSFVKEGFLRDLTLKAFKVYGALCSFKCNKKKTCFPSIRKLSEETNLHRDSVMKGTRELERKNLIESWMEGRKKIYRIKHIGEVEQSNRYGKSDPLNPNEVETNDLMGTEKTTHKVVLNDLPRITTLNNYSQRTNKNKDSFNEKIGKYIHGSLIELNNGQMMHWNDFQRLDPTEQRRLRPLE